MRSALVFLTFFYALQSSSQLIATSVENRSKFLLHSFSWTTKEKQGFQDGDNVIQVEKTGTKLQMAYTVRFDGLKHALIIRKTDAADKELAVNKVEDGEKQFGPVLTKPIEFGGKILVFYFRYVDKDSMKLYVSEINKGSLQLTNTRHLYSYQQDNVGVFKLGRALDKEIRLQASDDGSKLLVVFAANREEVYSCVFNSDMQVARQKTSTLAGTEDLGISDLYVDNNGNSAVAFSKELYSSETFNGSIAKKILVQRASSGEKLIDAEAWAVQGDLHNAHFKGSKDQSKIYIFGDYAGTIGNAGIWLSEIQPERLMGSRPKLFAYPDEFKKRVYDIGFGEKKKGEYGILDADLQLVEFDNGDLAVCGSPLLRHDGTFTDVGGRSKGYITFFAGPVMMAFLKGKSDGVFTLIPRYQNYCGGSKSLFVPYQDKLVVIYNDYAKYLNAELTDKVDPIRVNMVRELSLATAVVNKTGAIESRKMLAEGLSRMNFFDISHCEFGQGKKIVIPSASEDKKTDDMKVAVVSIQ